MPSSGGRLGQYGNIQSIAQLLEMFHGEAGLRGYEGSECWDEEAEAVQLGGIYWWVEVAIMFFSSHCSLEFRQTSISSHNNLLQLEQYLFIDD
jgi:hypothetical protein